MCMDRMRDTDDNNITRQQERVIPIILGINITILDQIRDTV